MIKVTLLGRVGGDPIVRQTKNGKSVANFSVADNLKVDGEQKTTWYNVACWEAKAEIAEKIVRKGDLVYVEGSPTVSSWTDKSGETRTEMTITCRFLQVEKQKKAQTDDRETASAIVEDFDALPF